jgi:signal transduction histidine kinase
MMSDPRHAFLSGASRMATLMREKDWSGSPLGPPDHWPQALRSVVNLMLGSAFPMFVAWGSELAQLYNDAYMAVMGDKHPAGIGRPLFENWAEISDDVGPLARKALEGQAQYLENLPLRVRRDGGHLEDTWFTFSYSPVQDESGAVAGLFCACIETTAGVRAQQESRAREDWLQALFDQAPGFAAVLRGPDHVFEQANEAYHHITGNRPLVGKTVAEALPEVVGQGFVGLLDGVYATGQPFVGRSMPVTVNQGSGVAPYEAFIDFMYQPLRGATGQIEGIFVQGHDVTEQHRAREALRAADRHKDEFLATLAHELRNPLAPIRTASHLLRSPRATPQARERASEIIGRQVGHMARLLDDLIDIARITQQRLVLKTERVTARAVVEAALETARPLVEAKQHQLKLEVASPDAQLDADPVRLTQVLSNLLNNASKYTDPGGSITLAVQATAGQVVFTVTDSGIGLSEAAMSGVFNMFAQEQSALERSEGGLGIGLALAKGLVELHGGTISAFSEGLGRGSRFVVQLPLAEAGARTAAGPEQPPADKPLSRTVLLADDNRDALDTMAELLRMDGHVVHTAHEGVAALETALRVRPDFIVLDIGMPGLNGYEVARRIRAEPWAAASFLVAATGWGREDDRRRTTDAGFDLHLTKPFDPERLAELIARPAA